MSSSTPSALESLDGGTAFRYRRRDSRERITDMNNREFSCQMLD
jgi:hypothetical protein